MSFNLEVEEDIEALYHFLQNELKRVKYRINSQTRSKFIEVQSIIEDVMHNEGKMLRPFLVLLSAQFGHYEAEKIQKLAGAVEILHMATLVHDDIIDEAKLRRRKPSIQSKYGKNMAVYTGDYLLAKSIGILNDEHFDPSNVRQLSQAISKICESEIIQYQNRFKALSIKNYLKVISGKTAALFAVSLYVGALESDCDEKLAKQLGRIGYEIGMAFQIIDDLLDFDENQQKIGKSTLLDFKNGYFTIPILFALKEKKVNLEDYSKADLIDFVRLNNGLTSAKRLAKKYTQRAFVRIDSLEPCHAKKVLRQFSKHLLERDY
ncbi:polyprenyl synthetase family protein [Fusibacter sp. 3D3]|uniref:polyprenyl synthetase family protein n=1 Tax=Fusibacter sp. 3D3 TaxID=1048380 RepID=UPI0008560A42|nr:polyprenyl synthetase family protein [Fusibacter sp. 3D3]GAU77354.1 heptaprenyl diphosphate synthase component II [Fusibacter sp. 3D3]